MNKEQVKITTPFIKLDALLKFAGVCGTGTEAKEAILSGDVMVDGEVCLMRGKKVYVGMQVQLLDEILLEVL